MQGHPKPVKSRLAVLTDQASIIWKGCSVNDTILQFFSYSHLPPHLQSVSKPFCELAHAIARGDNVAETGNLTFGPPLPINPERSVALRKLLEAKDAAVRALLFKE